MSLIIPQDNLLRRINSLIDFSFVYNEFVSKYCPDNGRIAQSPIRMFKYLLLKIIYDLSDVDVVERLRYDMYFKYFLEMVPEDDVIDAGSLCKFRKLRLKDLDLLINNTVTLAIEKGIIQSTSVIVDATYTGSFLSRLSHQMRSYLNHCNRNLIATIILVGNKSTK